MAVDKLVDSAQLDSDLASVANAIRAKSGGQAQLSFPTEFISEIGNIPSGGGGVDPDSDVLFIDYDGTALYGYSAAEFAQLSELPANPTHEGLTAQGWNWTKAQITAQLTAVPGAQVVVGQSYVTQSGDTEIDIEFVDNARLSPYLGIAVNGTATVNWGDNSTSTVNGSSLTSTIFTQHTYIAIGEYTIKISVSSGSEIAFYTSSSKTLLSANSSTANQNIVYANCVKRVRIGNDANISNYAFNLCACLESITIPKEISSIKTYAFSNVALKGIVIPKDVILTSSDSRIFNNTYSIENVSLPPGIGYIPSYTFYYCYALIHVTIPNGVTNMGTYCFSNCTMLKCMTIPNSVTSIGDYAFGSCFNLVYIKLPTSVGTALSASIFSSAKELKSITLPADVKTLNGSAFQTCCSLASITIPSTVTTIGTYVFQNCYGLGEMHFKPTTPPSVTNANAFSGIPADCKIYVPTGSLSSYTATGSKYPSSSTYTYIEE